MSILRSERRPMGSVFSLPSIRCCAASATAAFCKIQSFGTFDHAAGDPSVAHAELGLRIGIDVACTTTEWPITSSGLPVPTDMLRSDTATPALPSRAGDEVGRSAGAPHYPCSQGRSTGPALAGVREPQLPPA